MNMEEIMVLSIKHNVSNLHLCSAWPTRWRMRGKVEIAPFTTPDVENLLMYQLNEQQQVQWWKQGQIDFAIALAGSQQLRASAFVRQQGTSLALRLFPPDCPHLDDLQAPETIPELLGSENGLTLVTGAISSSRSMTLATTMEYLNQYVARHIPTLEDPIEYRCTSQHCLIQQREVGVHCASFAAGLHGALREDPDVILLGELRDVKAIRLALTATETGYLVLTMSHTRGAVQAIVWLMGAFSVTEKEPVRSQLTDSLRAVLSQKLEEDKLGGCMALFELFVSTPAVSNLIREGKTHQLPGVVQTGQQTDMQTSAQSRQQYQARGRI